MIPDRVNALGDSKTVNMNFYPACPNPELTVGIGRHSDIGTLTVLLQDGIGGLYVKLKLEEDIDAANKGSEWVEIPPTPGALVINVGDVLQVHIQKYFRIFSRPLFVLFKNLNYNFDKSVINP
jgi:isopenicillin N synthase-like dioxygenase